MFVAHQRCLQRSWPTYRYRQARRQASLDRAGPGAICLSQADGHAALRGW
jgi:hypothetical protein